MILKHCSNSNNSVHDFFFFLTIADLKKFSWCNVIQQIKNPPDRHLPFTFIRCGKQISLYNYAKNPHKSQQSVYVAEKM